MVVIVEMRILFKNSFPQISNNHDNSRNVRNTVYVPDTVQKHFVFININRVNPHLSIPSLTFSKDPNSKQLDKAKLILNKL